MGTKTMRFADIYSMGSTLGEGSYGKVSVVTRIQDGLKFAVKEISIGRMSDKEKTGAEHEARTTTNLFFPYF